MYKKPEVTYNKEGEPIEWTITLNSYQRNNLLLLLNICGYPSNCGVEPFTLANTGDWLGEIALMLSKNPENPDGLLEDTAATNISHSDFIRMVLDARSAGNWSK